MEYTIFRSKPIYRRFTNYALEYTKPIIIFYEPHEIMIKDSNKYL